MRLAVSVPEGADVLGVSESMLWSMLKSGAIARVKIGRRTVIRVAELERFLADHEHNGAPIVEIRAPQESSSVPRMEIAYE